MLRVFEVLVCFFYEETLTSPVTDISLFVFTLYKNFGNTGGHIARTPYGVWAPVSSIF